MAGANGPSVARVLRVDALILCVFASWTVIIKFLNPLCLAWAVSATEGELIRPYIMWDFWWVVHLLLAYWFWRRKPYACEFGIAVSLVEIVIIVAKLWLFLSDPLSPRTGAPPLIDRFLTAGWFINKTFLLTFFVFLLLQLLQTRFRRVLRQETLPSYIST